MQSDEMQARFQLSLPSPAGEGFSLDIDTQLPGRGITAVFGPSGCGKTTFLRCLAGLQKTSGGLLRVRDEIWQDGAHFLPTHERPLGYVFQEASLFPHLSAEGNLAYALKRAGAVSPGLYDRVVELMGIGPLLSRLPQRLSGGERQRVAIARALLIAPRLLLMDEPLASLDAERKREILPYLERLRSEFDLPIVYVSHAFEEVARLADHLMVMRGGRVVAQGDLSAVLSRIDLPVAMGEDTGVVLEGRIIERDSHWHLARVAFAGGDLWLRDGGDPVGREIRVRVLARDLSLSLACHEDTSILNRLPAEVAEIAADADSAMVLVRLRVGPSALVARLTRRSAEHLGLAPGSAVWAQVKSAAIVK
ncbi:molybdenum ABC transporter ATP-binding protein [Microbulbifer hainanensis]|uniref:molybdenum ABC transporter ATP-binding protein n=1 Tax=Microbulbifer hainanensis TaxID=2735675 RepID=UPI001865E9FE|nr:molybdenum ABC transporter ATP-binding protein [Microbulbifer hainanensis]